MILVTGGRGFIGSAVVRELVARHISVRTYDQRDGCDIRNPRQLAEAAIGCDAIIHLAGVLGTHELFDNPQQAIDVNVTGTLNVLEACRLNMCGYVGITMPQVFPSIYTATKVAATRLASAYHNTYHIPVSHVRAFNAYGPGQAHGPGHPQKIVPTFAVCAWRGERLPIWGDGTQTVDLIHVDDLARMLVDALDHGDDVTFDGGSGVAWTVNQVAAHVLQIAEQGCIVGNTVYLPMRRGETPTNIVAAGEGWDRLDWRPYPPDLYDTVMWYRDLAVAA